MTVQPRSLKSVRGGLRFFLRRGQQFVSARAAREALELITRQRDAILASCKEGIVGIDREAKVTLLNGAAATMLGCSLQEAIGTAAGMLLFQNDPARETHGDNAIAGVLAGGPPIVDAPVVVQHRNGTAIPVEHTIRPLHDRGGSIVGGVITFLDTSERRTIDQLKNEFVSVVSHELRTPLTSIRGALGLLAGGSVGQLPGQAARMIEIAVSNTDRLVGLINDILDVERLGSGKVTLAPQICSAADLITETVDRMRPLAEISGVRLESEPADVPLYGDRERLLQTLINLAGNAIKFSPRDTCVTVRVKADGNKARFEIEDQGDGIPPEKLQSVFERFEQIDASDTRQQGGSGLGLPICKSIVHLHGGDIGADSVIGGGSRFFFTIPIHGATSGNATTEQQVAGLDNDSSWPSPCVLLIEDDCDLAGIIATSLQRHGIKTWHAANGSDAIALAQRIEPDLVVLDVILPGIDGFGVVEWLRNHNVCSSVPVVVYTALDIHSSEGERLTLGPTEFLTKSRVSPESFEQRVVQRIREITSRKETRTDGTQTNFDRRR